LSNCLQNTLWPSVGLKNVCWLLLLSAGAILVHGYHPFIEDAEIYVPGIKKLLNPELYPVNDSFFASHARLTLFPDLIAWSVRITHLPLEWVLLGWHCACIFTFLVACWKLGRLCLGTQRAAWGSAGLIASLMTMPAAGTALYIMDQYLNTRSFSTASEVWVVVAILEKKHLQAVTWMIVAIVIHPLMGGLAFVLGALLFLRKRAIALTPAQAAAALLLPLGLFPPVSEPYRQVLDRHPYFFLLRWEWYEWLGIIGPPIILLGFAGIARRRKLVALDTICWTTAVFGMIFLGVGLTITIVPQLMRFVELQPMRSLLFVYIVLIVVSGGLVAEYVLATKIWRWIVLFVAICSGMFYVQRQLLPATTHVEWPSANSSNHWVAAFRWIRDNTPVDAYFALDPDYMRLPGEDQHGFRAVAERSRLADNVKDSGAATMFPALAVAWVQQTGSLKAWTDFDKSDFSRLGESYGVNWVVLTQPGVGGLECPYENPAVRICRLGSRTLSSPAK